MESSHVQESSILHSVGRVVGQCQLFEFLISVVVHPAGIIRETAWSKVETVFLLPNLRVFSWQVTHAVALIMCRHSFSDAHNTFPISLSFTLYKVCSYLGAFTCISVCISVRPILNLFLTISTCLRMLRWEDVKGFLLLILLEDLVAGTGYRLQVCFSHTREELCLLSAVALALF